MRALKTILIIVLALLGLEVVLGLFGPKTFRVERSTVIAATPEQVYPYISSLERMSNWGPWKKKDPEMKTTLENDGKVGALYTWEGNDKVGKGSQKIVEMKDNEGVKTELVFLKPWENTCFGTCDLAKAGDSTKVTWGIEGNIGFMMRGMMMFMNMESKVAPDFEEGMANLKAMVEKDVADAKANATPAYVVQTGDRPAALYVGVKSDPKMPQADISKFYMDSAPKVYEALGKAGITPAGPLSGLYFDWNTETKTTSMMVAVPVPATAKGKLKGFAQEEVGAGKAYWTVLTGPYSGMMGAHTAVGEKLKADGAESTLVLEESLKGQQQEKDSSLWVTNIIYMVK